MKNKIIGSLEEWDSILNYYRPNGSSKTWYLNELKTVHPPLMWGNWNIFKESGEMFENLEHVIIPNNINNIVEFIPIDNIKDKNHLYIINVYNPNFFTKNKSIGFSCISEKYKNDIINGKSKIVILYLFEGFSGMDGNNDFEIIEEWRIKEKFPSKSVYCITGNLIGSEIVKNKNLDIEVFNINVFDRMNSNFISSPLLFEPENDKHLFLSYNRLPKKHRILLAYELIKNNIFNKGLFSLGKPTFEVVNPLMYNRTIDKYIINQIISRTPFIIDEKYDLTYNLAANISIDDYKKTFISIVTETIVSNNTLFLSEKIWKPIIVGHPFIIYGNPNTLKYLKNIGYKTFDKWIDESYDSEINEDIRCSMIVNEINKFKDLSIEELKNIRQEMSEVCEYNKQHYTKLLEQNWTGDLNNNLVKHLEFIWYTFNNDVTDSTLNSDYTPNVPTVKDTLPTVTNIDVPIPIPNINITNIVNKNERKYLPTLADLLDRLSICQLKEVFIPEYKDEYSKEIQDILHDIDICLEDVDTEIRSRTLRAIVVLSQINAHIWNNESNYRKGIKDGNLELTHGLNGIRNTAKNIIQEIIGGRKDYKIDCLASEFKDWEISW